GIACQWESRQRQDGKPPQQKAEANHDSNRWFPVEKLHATGEDVPHLHVSQTFPRKCSSDQPCCRPCSCPGRHMSHFQPEVVQIMPREACTPGEAAEMTVAGIHPADPERMRAACVRAAKSRSRCVVACLFRCLDCFLRYVTRLPPREREGTWPLAQFPI